MNLSDWWMGYLLGLATAPIVVFVTFAVLAIFDLVFWVKKRVRIWRQAGQVFGWRVTCLVCQRRMWLMWAKTIPQRPGSRLAEDYPIYCKTHLPKVTE